LWNIPRPQYACALPAVHSRTVCVDGRQQGVPLEEAADCCVRCLSCCTTEAVREETWKEVWGEAYQQKLESARSFKGSGVPLGVIADSLNLPLEVDASGNNDRCAQEFAAIYSIEQKALEIARTMKIDKEPTGKIIPVQA
jgi:hypothetical protein